MALALRILITGAGGKAGSWAIRGQQIGNALGATVQPYAPMDVIRRHDVVVVVKRTPAVLIDAIRRSGVPWVYDVVDPWPQPTGNARAPDDARAWLHGHVAALNPRTCLYATRQQAIDADWPGSVVPHHARPGQLRNPIRRTIERIGYEGRPDYIARIVDQMRPRLSGVEIVINPDRLADVDAVLAMRAGVWDGYAPRHWKSGVKLANAQATGTPVICACEAGYAEMASGAELWADTAPEALAALQILGPQMTRAEISGRLLARGQHYTLPMIAQRYQECIESLLSTY